MPFGLRRNFIFWLLAIALACGGFWIFANLIFQYFDQQHVRWEQQHAAESRMPRLVAPSLSDVEKIQIQETVRQTAEDPPPTFRTLPLDTYPTILAIISHAVYDPNVAGSRFPPLKVITKDRRELRFQFGVSEERRMFVCEGDNCFRTELMLEEFRKLMAAPGEHDE